MLYVNTLTTVTHSHIFRKVNEDHEINLVQLIIVDCRILSSIIDNILSYLETRCTLRHICMFFFTNSSKNHEICLAVYCGVTEYLPELLCYIC